MSDKCDGGPAFPQSETAHGNTVHAEHGEGGMSLRDWFAGQALANPQIADASSGNICLKNAEYAYAAADAMLEQRKIEK